uniref:Cysteine-rich protein n=1 Tax=Spironucleus salmonicida TaxID=348837 RepID=V6LJC4_9EUKA|eukprot:EST44675.1 Hypothetical protein SS50377_15452 [Spironucleus salmonicida]
MAESGTCQKRENKCKAGFYCPATDDTSANCWHAPGKQFSVKAVPAQITNKQIIVHNVMDLFVLRASLALI